MRSFIRHPTDMPIEILLDEQAAASDALRNVSRSGLCFRYPTAVAKGGVIRVRIAIAAPAFEARCRVIWCQPEGDAFQVGVEFLDRDDLFRARMVEQICHIEQYRQEVREHDGRTLSGHEAALEWIEKYAPSFPRPEDAGGDPHKPH
jgi:hypothetical protein